MKKGIFFIGGILITLLFLVFIAGYFWIDIGVKENIAGGAGNFRAGILHH